MENKYEKNLKSFFRENGRYAAASFLIPFLILALVYLSIGIYPGAAEVFWQVMPFHNFLIFMQASEMSFLESKVFSIHGMLLWA
ncbi:hypothetical protein QUB72_03675 [Enterococcus faecium]|nr:hypothetical protein [Enterococcus faecium]